MDYHGLGSYQQQTYVLETEQFMIKDTADLVSGEDTVCFPDVSFSHGRRVRELSRESSPSFMIQLYPKGPVS